MVLRYLSRMCMCIEFAIQPKIEIMPGWHGMQNGQKPEMKKKEIEMENGPRLDRGKKWPKNGFLSEFSIIFSFLGLFFSIFVPVQLGAVFQFDFQLFFSSPCLASGHLPCHASPA